MEIDWESLWAPHDPPTYREVLKRIENGDRVLEVGAGDLRLAREIANRAQEVWAIERQATLLIRAMEAEPLPGNLHVICADARLALFPERITLAVLLMRHCTHFELYARKLVAAGCHRIITNARWRAGVELVDLAGERQAFPGLRFGWYACLCGAVGFKPGPADEITPETEGIIHEVLNCPNCGSRYG